PPPPRSSTLFPSTTLFRSEQTGRALNAAHAIGLVHRDVKPGNILITPTGQVKLTDFGIAKSMGASAMTQTGMVVGTAQYISPEQAMGNDTTPAGDVYSLGVVGYECLAGRRPFVADSPVTIAMMHVRGAPPPLPAATPAPVRGPRPPACAQAPPAPRPRLSRCCSCGPRLPRCPTRSRRRCGGSSPTPWPRPPTTATRTVRPSPTRSPTCAPAAPPGSPRGQRAPPEPPRGSPPVPRP